MSLLTSLMATKSETRDLVSVCAQKSEADGGFGFRATRSQTAYGASVYLLKLHGLDNEPERACNADASSEALANFLNPNSSLSTWRDVNINEVKTIRMVLNVEPE